MFVDEICIYLIDAYHLHWESERVRTEMATNPTFSMLHEQDLVIVLFVLIHLTNVLRDDLLILLIRDVAKDHRDQINAASFCLALLFNNFEIQLDEKRK